MQTYHKPTFRLNSGLFVVFLGLAVVLWILMPDRYPHHFDLTGNPTSWTEKNPDMWIILVFFGAFSFIKLHLVQRYLVNDPDSGFFTVPCKKEFMKLPHEQKHRIVQRINRMLGILNTTLLITFISIMIMTWFTAAYPESAGTVLSRYTLFLAVAAMIFIPLIEMMITVRIIKKEVG